MADRPGEGGVTGLVIAGGRGSRMGGIDKGLVPFCGVPLALHAARRLAPQVDALCVNANRSAATYAAWGWPVVADAAAHGVAPAFDGPLAGLLAGLRACTTRRLLAVPCDSPRFPADLAQRLSATLDAAGADIAMAASRGADGTPQVQPVFLLLPTDLQESLAAFVAGGGRAVRQWAQRHRLAVVPFDAPHDDPLAFANANTAAELAALEATLR